MSLFPPRWLFRDGLLPEQTYFVGFARSQLTVDAIRTSCMPYLKVKLDLRRNSSEGRLKDFIADTCTYKEHDQTNLQMNNWNSLLTVHSLLLIRFIPLLSLCICFHSLTQVTDKDSDRLAAFFGRNTYISGNYGEESSFSKLDTHILSLPGGSMANRLFYLALPPTVYHDVTKNIKHCCMSTKSVHTNLLLSNCTTPALSHSLLVYFTFFRC